MDIEQIWADFDSLREAQPEAAPSEYLCSFCNVPKVIFDLPTCLECGRVDSGYICEEPEWRSGAGEGPDPSRVGAPVNVDHFSEAWGRTTYMTVNRNASWDLKRLARINHHSTMNHRDRALFHAYAQMDLVGKQILSLPDSVMYSAKIKYRKFNEAVLTRGAVRNGIKANCIFQACRESGVARTTQEIASAFGIPARDLSRTFEIYQEQVPETVVHVTTAADLVSRFFNSITGIPESDRGRVKAGIIRKCKSLEDRVELMGRTPKAVACAVIAMSLKDLKGTPSRAELCKICDISLPTLGKIETLIGT